MFLPFDDPPPPDPPPAPVPRPGPARRTGGNVTLLLGPPRGGKTRVLLTAYVAALRAAWADGRLGACLWLTPNRRSRAAVLAELGDAVGGALPDAGVKTFDNLTDELLHDARLWAAADGEDGEDEGASGGRFRMLTAPARRRVLRAVIDAAADAGRLQHFAPIAGTAGFLSLLDRQVRAWKFEETRPEDAAASATNAARRDLAALYADYQRRLHAPPDGGPPLFDAEGRVWQARTLLDDAADGGSGPAAPDLLIVDGFTSFTRTQRDLLAALADRAGRSIVALPDERPPSAAGDPDRGDLFQRVRDEVAALRDRLGLRADADRWHAAQRPDDALGCLAARLFDEADGAPEPRSEASGITLLEAGAVPSEVRAVVGRVKALLLKDVPAHRVVIAARSLAPYRDELTRLCDAAGVPLDLERPEPLARRPAVRALLAPLRLVAGRWAFADLVRLLRGGWFDLISSPSPQADDLSSNPAVAVARVLREANLAEGREDVLRAARRSAERLEAERLEKAEPARRLDPGEPTPADRRLALAALERLREVLDPLRTPTDFPAWVTRLRTVADALRFAPPPPGAVPRLDWEDDDRDAAALWELLDATAEDAAREAAAEAGLPFDPDAGEQPAGPPLTLPEFLAAADEVLAAAVAEGPPAVPGGVLVTDAETARTAGCDHLFLLGLGEGQFPAPAADADVRPPDEDPAAAADAAARAEMLLFFGVVTRPRTSLTLSWPTLDEEARRRYPGPFVQAVRDLFTAEALPSERVDSLSPVPRGADVLTADDVRVWAVAAMGAGDAAPLAGVLSRPAEAVAGRATVAAVRALAARTRRKGVTAFDGGLSAKHRRAWAGERPRSHEFSATELEAFARHPFRYFLERVLETARPEPPGLAEDWLHRGTVVHRALKRAYGPPAEDGEAAEPLDRLRDELAAATPRRGSLTDWQAGAWAAELGAYELLAERFAGQAEDYETKFRGAWGSEPVPHGLEVAFGERTPEEEGDESVKRAPAAVFGAGEDAVRVTGRIDRLDVGVTKDGRTVFNVVDFKTGAPHTFKPDAVDAGTGLQLPIYAVAAARLGLAPPGAEPWGLGFWGVADDGYVPCTGGRNRAVAAADVWREPGLADRLDAALPALAAALRAGRFPVNPDEDEAKRSPDVAKVARSAELRPRAAELGKWPPPWRVDLLAPAG